MTTKLKNNGMQRIYWRLAGAPLVLVAMLLYTPQALSNPPLDWPEGGSFALTGEAEGLDPANLTEVQAVLARNFPLTRSLLIVRNGRLAVEKYFGGARSDEAYNIASVTKSVTSTLFGIAMGEGKLAGSHLTVADVFPEESAHLADPRTKLITFKQLLTMTAGLRWHDRGDDFWRWRHSRNRSRSLLRLHQQHDPGRVFTYNTAVSHPIGVAIARAIDMNLMAYANTRLFGPMGEQLKSWRLDPLGQNTGGMGIRLTPRQMAKLGLLYLRGGKWGDRKIVPESWIREATTIHVWFSEKAGYGYQYWIREFAGCAAFYALGRGGQYIVTVPDKDLVIVVTENFQVKSRAALKFIPS